MFPINGKYCFSLFSFEVKEVIPFPSEEELRAHTAIPNIVFPSDHIACVADLGWRDKSEKEGI